MTPTYASLMAATKAHSDAVLAVGRAKYGEGEHFAIGALHGMLADAISELPPQARADYVERLNRITARYILEAQDVTEKKLAETR